MSHITTVKTKITDLNAAEAAALECGVELRRNQKTFRSFGGQRLACDAAISIPASNPLSQDAYEIGLIRQADGSYAINLDNWNDGNGLNSLVGRDAVKLQQLYGIHAATNAARKQGMNVSRQQLPGGSIRLICEPKPQFAQATAGGGWAGSGY